MDDIIDYVINASKLISSPEVFNFPHSKKSPRILKMRKRKRSDDLDPVLPSLQQLSCSALARSLWLEKLKFSRLPEESSHLDRPFLENCKLQILTFLKENFPLISDLCKVTISQEVNSMMEKMMDQFSHLSPTNLIRHVLETREWSDFTLSMWSCVKDKIRLFIFFRIFTRIITRIDRIQIMRLNPLPDYELEMYLEVWKDAPKHYKMNIIDELVQTWDYSQFERRKMRKVTPPRDVRFLQKLISDFDFAERIEIWRKNWISLMVDVKLNDLDPLMRIFCEKQQEFEQFKMEWLSRDEMIIDYYCRLLRYKMFDRLEEVLNFYSSDESKTLELAKSILRVHFGIDITWSGSPYGNFSRSGYGDQIRIVQFGGWLGRAIKAPEFEHLFEKNVTKMRLHWCSLMGSVDVPFDEMHNFLKIILPEEEVVFYEREFIRSFFMRNNSPCIEYLRRNYNNFFRFHFIRKLKQFETFVNRIFPSAKEAASFKKEIIFTRDLMDTLIIEWHSGLMQCDGVRNFVAFCLPCKHDLNEWKVLFARAVLQNLRKYKNIEIFSCHRAFFDDQKIIFSWCLDSKPLVDAFKKTTTIDEILLILTHGCSDIRAAGDEIHLMMNRILKWWYNTMEDVVDFKLNKLVEFPNDAAKTAVLLGFPREIQAFNDCMTVEQRRAQIARTMFTSDVQRLLSRFQSR